LSYNSFSGPFPDHFYDLAETFDFDISHNNFTGKLSEKVSKMGLNKDDDKKVFDFSYNKFDGDIPEEFGQINMLVKLALVNNSFGGNVPDAICKNTGIRYNELKDLSVNCSDVECTCCNPSCFPSDLIQKLVDGPAKMKKEHLEYWKATKDPTWTGSPRTAQNKAISWFVDDQKNRTAIENPTQRVVLATLYYATKGDSWKYNSTFLTDDDECNWFGIICNTEKNVTEINLDSNGLQGFLPEELQGLPQLKLLNVTDNNLKIPPSLKNLVTLVIDA